MRFEWDENKNRINQIKHSVDFYDAIEIFKDDKRIEIIDQRKDYGEIRYQAIGLVDNEIMHTVYTIRNENHRIISARRGSKNERKNYYSRTD